MLPPEEAQHVLYSYLLSFPRIYTIVPRWYKFGHAVTSTVLQFVHVQFGVPTTLQKQPQSDDYTSCRLARKMVV